jgi:hypothetical protein
VRKHLRGPITEMFMYDDTGDARYREALLNVYPEFTHINAGPRQGFGGAVANAWSQVYQLSDAGHVFHLEGDFRFDRDVDLDAIRQTLDDQPHLAHMALRRQAWAPAEVAAGGVVEMHPEAYADSADDAGNRWLEHELFFTTNPSLIRMNLIRRGWPDVPQSERRFTEYLLREGTPEVPGGQVRFGYWGSRDDGPWIHHIGTERIGKGY